MSRHHPLRQPAAALLGALVLLHTTGCTTWRTFTPTTPKQIEELAPLPIRIVTTTGDTIVAQRYQVRGDSIVLRTGGGGAATDPTRTLALAGLRSIEGRTTNTAGTVVLGAAMVAGVLGLIAVANAGNFSWGSAQ